MQDFNKKLRERWQDKRKKASNWKSLIIKILILVAIIYVVNHISKSKNIDWSTLSNKADSVQTAPDTLKEQ